MFESRELSLDSSEPTHRVLRTKKLCGTRVTRTDGQSKSRSESKAEALQLRPFFGFYGGKWRDASKYYPVPRHDTIVEPFAGSAGYALRYYDRKVILCEIDPVLASIWKYLTKVPPKEILRIPDLGSAETIDDLKVCQEARWLVGLWLNRGVSSPRRSPSKWMRMEIRPGSFWGERVRSTVARQVTAIRHWTVHNCSYADAPLPRTATWFIDPPYQHAGQHYKHGSAGIEYGQLAAWCLKKNGQVIVCENEGADWLPFNPLASVKTTRARRSREVIWTNNSGSSRAQPHREKKGTR